MIIGIDLGTTNSTVAVWRDGQPQLIPNAIGDYLTPSAVSVTDDGTILVGIAARDRQSTHPRDTATAFKRYMGTRHLTKLGGIEFSAEDLSAIVLGRLKADAEAYLGEPVTEAVITVPAYFNDRQRKATRRAGELAGLDVRRLLNEPTAAALAFGIQDNAEREPFLVFDLGGGTFDVSIVEVFDGVVEVRASAGDNRLGGEDFNDMLAAFARTRLDMEAIGTRVSPAVLHELMRAAAERTRRELTVSDRAAFRITVGDTVFETDISAQEFEAQAAALIDRLRDPVLRSLRESDIRVDGLSEIVLVGKAVTRMFSRFPNASAPPACRSSAVHPDHAVGLGAAVQAGLLAKDAALDEIRLTDVCPFSLGVDTTERDARGAWHPGLFSPIIERNTPIPASRISYFRTLSDNQREVQFGIYQGEAREVRNNIKLGQLSVPVPPRPAGEIAVECRFSYDSSGLLEVDVRIPETGLTRNLVIIDEADAMSERELGQRREALAALKFHPRDGSENAALTARATRCYESFIGEHRERIGQAMLLFQSALDRQDPRAIRVAHEELTALLDALEGERFL